MAKKSSEKYSGLNSETEPKLTKKALCVSFTQLKNVPILHSKALTP